MSRQTPQAPQRGDTEETDVPEPTVTPCCTPDDRSTCCEPAATADCCKDETATGRCACR